jgi:hypothetical protein
MAALPKPSPVLAVLVAPFRHRTADDVALLNKAKHALLATGCVPVFLPDTLRDVLDDHAPTQRDVALDASRAWVTMAAKMPGAILVVVGSSMSEGMRVDLDAWRAVSGHGPVLKFGEEGARESTVDEALAGFARSAVAHGGS